MTIAAITVYYNIKLEYSIFVMFSIKGEMTIITAVNIRNHIGTLVGSPNLEVRGMGIPTMSPGTAWDQEAGTKK